jgi:hypothetical protein
MKSLNEAERMDSLYHVEVHPQDPDHAFVVIYKGESLQPLLMQEDASQ